MSMRRFGVGLALAGLAGFVTSCGGSGGGGGGDSGDVLRALFFADPDVDGVGEAFVVDYAAPGVATKLNRSVGVSGTRPLFFVTGLGDEVALYSTDHDAPGVFELFAVRYDAPGVATKLNSPLVAGGDVQDAVLSPDGTRAVYLADQDTDNVAELYVVELDAPGVSTKVSVPTFGILNGRTRFHPDGDRVFYMGAVTPGSAELHVVDLATPTVATTVNGPLVVGGNVRAYRVAPDGSQVLYVAEEQTVGVEELFRVDLSQLGVSTKMNPPLAAGGDVSSVHFRLSPDGDRVVYRADAAADEVQELWVVANASPGVATRLHPPLAGTRDVLALGPFVPGSDLVLYTADQLTDGQSEIFMVDFVSLGPAVRVNAPLVANGNAGSPLVDPDGEQILYLADQNVDEVREAFLVAVDSPGVAVQASDTMPVGSGGVLSAAYSVDGRFVQYDADQDTPGVAEVYVVVTASPGPRASAKLTPPLSPGTDVTGHLPIPVGLLLEQFGL
jgi:hypothetical protein